jgi:hypothetical protein
MVDSNSHSFKKQFVVPRPLESETRPVGRQENSLLRALIGNPTI